MLLAATLFFHSLGVTPTIANEKYHCNIFAPDGDLAMARSALKSQRYAEALELSKKCAEGGSSYAAFLAGAIYMNGWGIQANKQKAYYWLKMAANRGEYQAAVHLGAMYANGDGTIKDLAKAHMWFNVIASKYDVNGTPYEQTWTQNALKARTEVEKEMSGEALSDAMKLARQCLEKKVMIMEGHWYHKEGGEEC